MVRAIRIKVGPSLFHNFQSTFLAANTELSDEINKATLKQLY